MSTLARKLMNGFAGIEFVGYATAGGGNSTGSIPLNTGLLGGSRSAVQEGDLVVAFYGASTTADATLSITDGTNNYTLIGSELYVNDTQDANLRAAYKFMGLTPDTSVSFGTPGSSNARSNIVMVFSGVNATPLDVTPTTATGVDSILANPPAITPVTPGAVILTVGAGAWSGTGAFDYTTTDADLIPFVSRSGANTNDVVMAAGLKSDWVSGPYNPATFGWGGTDSTNYSWAAMTLALRPK